MTPLSLLFAYLCVGFCVSFPGLACSYIMVNVLNFTASDVATTALMCSIPWCVKPLWAFISDNVPIFGYRRRPYVCIFSLAASIFIAITPDYANVYAQTEFVGMLICTSFALCFVDIAIDGSVMVLVAKEKGVNEGKAQTHSWIARIGGGTLAAGWSGFVYETWGFRAMMLGCAMLPLLLAFVALDIPDERIVAVRIPEKDRKSPLNALRAIVSSLKECRYVLYAAVIVSLVPEINTSMFFYLLSTHATPKEMSLVDVSGSLSSLVTLGMYNIVRPSHRCAFFTGVVLNAVAAAVASLMANDAVPWLLQGAALQAAVSAVGSALVLMPTVTVLGKTAAKAESEATVYSFALSVLNLASVGSESLASIAMRQLSITKGNVNNIRIFVGVISVITLMTAPSAWLFPSSSDRRRNYVHHDDDSDCDSNDQLLAGGVSKKQHRKVFELSMGTDSDNEAADQTTEEGSSTDEGSGSGSSGSEEEAVPKGVPV